MKSLFFALTLLLPVAFTAQAAETPNHKRALSDSLRLLNEKQNIARLTVLKTKSENCIAANEKCNKINLDYEKNSYAFSRGDVVSFSYLGEGIAEQPCKTDICHGNTRETKEYLLVIQGVNDARWWSIPEVIMLKFRYVKTTSQFDGRVTYSSELEAQDDGSEE